MESLTTPSQDLKNATPSNGASESKSTPMLKQYLEIKSRHKDCILFFRLGDFYEMFYDDAKIGSQVLDLVLTSRGHEKTGKIPMCGLPYHAAEGYIAKLIKAGLKVAICEQVEDPAQAQGIVRRDVIRTITAGTFLDETEGDLRYILSIVPNSKAIGLAFTDTVNGALQANQYSDEQKVIEIIARLPVCECVFPESQEERIKSLLSHPLLRSKNIILSPYQDWCFNPEIARKSLCEHFSTHSLTGFGIDELPLAQAGAGALLEYLRQMNKQPLRHIDKISLYADGDYVFISPAACRGLELEDVRRTLDHTLTSMGKRLFQTWLYYPLKNTAMIKKRQQAVTLLKNAVKTRETLQQILRYIPDVERSLSRLSCGYTSAKDLLAIRNALSRVPEIQQTIQSCASQNTLFNVRDLPSLRQLLEDAISPEIPLSHPEGKVIKKGYNAELDELRNIQDHGREWLKSLQEQEIKRTGIHSLKIGFNNVFGYYIEITKTNLNAVPADYIRKQTLVNAERFITPQLKEYEDKILTAEDKILKIENELIKNIQKEILNNSAALHEFSQNIALLDVLCSLSVLALLPGYILPDITEDLEIDIKDGRHPVVEKICAGSFVPNDTLLDAQENHLIILTGPNMAGKSTYIRQIALLVILGQIGSYLPAASARIGIVDKIFTRIGAHDDMSKGQSTFMVEMSEAADILNNLTDRSLIILDEIGRGTSTYDGLSLAWAIAEHLKNTKARALFATHFHELTALAEEHSGVKNYNVAVKEWKDEIVFLHKIIPGSTDDSYGIYVAKLAGIPKSVIKRSQQILTQLELQNNLKDTIQKKNSREDQLTLFSRAADPVAEELKKTLEEIDINSLTPLEALNKLQGLTELLKEHKST